ncbi:MAG: helix-turn-helix domain-containing protein [Nitriliruptorales bacterium]|nr:helix-turn-helix domain-containing protein [Nitriliruptorales bacterium]
MRDNSSDGAASRLGTQLRARRKALRLTQQEVAELAGIAQRTVSLLETGGADTRLETVTAVASVLGLEIVAVDHERAPEILAAEGRA